MLRSNKDIEGLGVGATDGLIGHVKDFYFDDQAWGVRYVAVDAGAWLASQKVKILLIAICQPDWTERLLPASMTKKQKINSPDIDTERPVSRQNEIQSSGYHGSPHYRGAGASGDGAHAHAGHTGRRDPGQDGRPVADRGRHRRWALNLDAAVDGVTARAFSAAATMLCIEEIRRDPTILQLEVVE